MVLSNPNSIGRRVLRKYLTPWLWEHSSHEMVCGKVSFSQFGEDLLLEKIFAGQPSGFYVDVGAYDPVYLSNTYKLYRGGWRGILIDGDPRAIERLRKLRPRDTTIWSAVGDYDGEVSFTLFENGTFSSLSKFANRVAPEWARGKSGVVVPGRRLSEILDQEKVVEVDLLNVDCEGGDLAVMESFDWTRWRPRVVCVEDDAPGWVSSPMTCFMREHGYRLYSRLDVSSLFVPFE